MIANDDKRIKSIDSLETFPHGTRRDVVCKKAEIKFNNIMMINFDDVTKENIKEHNPNWPQIPDHPYRILIIGGSGSGKANSLFNLSHQPDIDKLYLYAKGESKYQFLINKRQSTGLTHLNDSKVFIEYSNHMDNNYKNIEEYNPNKECEILIVLKILIWLLINAVIKNLI